jgi:hypothetical protein
MRNLDTFCKYLLVLEIKGSAKPSLKRTQVSHSLVRGVSYTPFDYSSFLSSSMATLDGIGK